MRNIVNLRCYVICNHGKIILNCHNLKMDAKTLFNIKCTITEEVEDRPMIYDKANKDYSQTIKRMRCFDKTVAVISRDDVDGEFYFLLS